ncbi:hypothetical protein Glove_86g87 [Diversispora epigaea]|uniref:Serine-threonine/tyrosine-protein kinase catalytic domain-containing protein n=1 Tax=Diversispora epigaea TaxID=1348612 RepID=A0A397JFN8_9GLOM|nr:hypothetical protein Glove_86g87 [Diversispora epigaea]
MIEFLKVVRTVDSFGFFTHYYGISKNPSTQNYIIVMNLFDDDLHNFLTKTFWKLGWQSKIRNNINNSERGNKFTRESDIYSLDGIMYEIVTAQRPFAGQAHDTYLIIDICNGVRSKVPDFMLNWIPEWYLDLMYRCWSGDPSECPTAKEK